MTAQIESAKRALRLFLLAEERGEFPLIDREEVVSHALLSGLLHHWPSQASAELLALLARCERIKATEQSRWTVQRRIAIAKLARAFVT